MTSKILEGEFTRIELDLEKVGIKAVQSAKRQDLKNVSSSKPMAKD